MLFLLQTKYLSTTSVKALNIKKQVTESNTVNFFLQKQ